jgi:hypothetical protein
MATNYAVTVTMKREYRTTITIRASSQTKAEEAALAAFEKHACEEGLQGCYLGLPSPWDEHESRDQDPEIDRTFHCVDCGKDTGSSGEYYMVADELWAETGLAPNGGMLCLVDLERRIGRRLTEDDFTAIFPQSWDEHVAARSATEPAQLELSV